MPMELIQHAKVMPKYAIIYQPCPTCNGSGQAAVSWPVTPVLEVKKDNGKIIFVVFSVNGK